MKFFINGPISCGHFYLLLNWVFLSCNFTFALHGQEIILQESDSINLIFVGDVMGHTPQIKSAELVKDLHYDYHPNFKYVKPVIAAADLAVANLELTLPGQPPYTGYPIFRSPNELATALRDAGFDLITTANNHANDSRNTGLVNTIQTLDSKGFYQTGTFKNQREKDLNYPLVVYKKGFKLVFLTYTFSTNQIRTRYPCIVNMIDNEQIEYDMEVANAMSPDAIIVLLHWGSEYKIHENEQQQELAQNLALLGADIIIGSHPHVVQPIKEIETKGRDRKTLVAYSLGNFISNQNRTNTDGGIMLEITLKRNTLGKLISLKHHYIPIWRYIRKNRDNKKEFYTIPISLLEKDLANKFNMSKKDRHSFNFYANNLRNHLGNFESSEKKVDF